MAGAFLLASWLAAAAQPTPPTSEAEATRPQVNSWIAGAERFRNICRDMGEGQTYSEFRSNPALSPQSQSTNRMFVDAIARFCAHGDFVFLGRPAGRECTERAVFDRRHLDVIASLALIRTGPIHEIRLECFELQGVGELRFERLHAANLVLINFRAERMLVLNSQIAAGVQIDAAEITSDVFMSRLSDTGSVAIRNSKVLNKRANRYDTVFDVVDSNVRNVIIYRSEIDGGVNVRGLTTARNLEILGSSHIKGPVLATGVTMGQALLVDDATIDGNFAFAYATMTQLLVSGGRFGANLTLTSAKVEDRLSISSKSTVKGNVAANHLKVGALLLITNSTVEGRLSLDQFSSDLLEISDAGVTGDVSMQYGRVGRRAIFLRAKLSGELDARGMRAAAIVLNKTEATKYTNFDYADAERFDILDSKFGDALDFDYARAGFMTVEGTTVARRLYAQYARFGSLILSKGTFGLPECKSGCTTSLFNAEIGYLNVRDSTLRSLWAGNGRFRVLLFSRSKSTTLNCADCLVEQYALIGGHVSEYADLSGAEIKGTLAFGEDGARAGWGERATLSLAELRADAIAADSCDLMRERFIDGRVTLCTEMAERDRRFVPTNLTGARYRTIVPGRYKLSADVPPPAPVDARSMANDQAPVIATPARAQAQPSPPAASKLSPPLIDLPPQRLVEFLASNSQTTYNPQPYEAMADALSTSGKSLEAIEIRVARINDRLQKVETNPFIQGWYWLYYYVSHYGFKNWRAFLIFIGLIFFGAVLHYFTARRIRQDTASPDDGDENHRADRMLYSVWFSLDRAVPPLRLDPRREDEQHFPWGIRQWFYVHRILGTVLISVFAAGLAGLGH